MKKTFSFLFACALALSPVDTWAAVAPYDGQAQLEAARADFENWQKYLPDDMFAAHVSMPGSHDTATGHNVTFASSSKAQEVLLEDQIKGGIRAFDFRPGFYSTTTDGQTVVTINCNHGMGKAELTMDEAFTILQNYLKEHPSEFFAMHLFRGYPTSDPSEPNRSIFDAAVDELFNKKFNDMFIDFDPYLTVKEMRGKVVVFRRDRISWCHINKAGNLGGWPGDKDLWVEGAAAAATNALNPTKTGRVRVTDVSSPKNEDELNTKLNSITNLFTANCTQQTPNQAKAAGAYKPEWSMIFTSGEYTSGQKGYLTCATHTNPHLTKLINEATVAGPTGIVFSDWVLIDKHEYSGTEYEVKGIDLVKAIAENNFKYAADYILDDELFNAENDFTKEPDVFGNNTYFMRNVGTGKFLAAGADWGTHAVLGDHGIRIKTFFDNRTGNYLLQTTFVQGGIENYLGDNCYIDNGAPNPFKAVKAEGSNAYYMTFQGVDEDNKPVTYALTPEQAVNTYADGAQWLVENRALVEGNLNQQWEFVTEEDLVKELVEQATPQNPVDLTFKIHGYKFDPNDDNENNAWVFTNTQAKTSTLYKVSTQVWGSNEWNDKDMIYRVYIDRVSASYPDNYSWSLTQDVTGLPAGVYTVSANAMADNMPMEGEGKFEMTANGVDMTEGIHTEASGTYTCDKGSALDFFRNAELNNCLVKAINVVVEEDGVLHIRMARPLTTATGKENFFFDNFSLIYHGPAGMEAVEYTPADEYDTMILPFEAEIPEGLEVYATSSYEYKLPLYHVLVLEKQNVIEANTPYIVRTSAEAGQAETYTFWGVKGETEGTFTAGLLTGSHNEVEVPVGAFKLGYLNPDFMGFVRVDATGTNLEAGRAYIHDTEDEAINAEGSMVGQLRFEVNPDDLTGVENLATEELGATSIVDVYNLAGVQVLRGVAYGTVAGSLESGIYIIRTAGKAIKVAL